MNKRRRTPSIASRSVDEDTNESDSQSVGAMETSRKKRKLDPVRKRSFILLLFSVPLLKSIHSNPFLSERTNFTDTSIDYHRDRVFH